MPIFVGTEGDKKFYRYGSTGKKYYFKTYTGGLRALHKAKKQELAILLTRQKF